MDIGYVNDKVKMTHFFLHYALLVAIKYNMVIKKDPLRAREIPAMKHGKSQAIETLISEEALLLAKYLRNERNVWTPRMSRP